MTTRETANETAKPTAKSGTSPATRSCRASQSANTEAAPSVGIARKNENSSAAGVRGRRRGRR